MKYRWIDPNTGKSHILAKKWDNKIIGEFPCVSIPQRIIVSLDSVVPLVRKQPKT